MINVFIKIEANKLLSHRKKNYEINLNSGTTTSYSRNYKFMSEKKLKTVKKYINEYLKKEFIRPSFFINIIISFFDQKIRRKISILREL